ncbi:hypothetical protein F4777DRAFT_239771 [Nemania sp. FL0916]|nr:hypothetical protein F4777DRAFT_239771 [Nemania sp. FL0916]
MPRLANARSRIQTVRSRIQDVAHIPTRRGHTKEEPTMSSDTEAESPDEDEDPDKGQHFDEAQYSDRDHYSDEDQYSDEAQCSDEDQYYNEDDYTNESENEDEGEVEDETDGEIEDEFEDGIDDEDDNEVEDEVESEVEATGEGRDGVPLSGPSPLATPPPRRPQFPPTPPDSTSKFEIPLLDLNASCKGKPNTPEKSQRRSLAQIDEAIIKRLKGKLSVIESKREDYGDVYCFKVILASNPQKTVFKIGSTKGPEQDRMEKIQRKCGHVKMDHLEDPEGNSMLFYKRAEGLMHEELRDFKDDFECPCKTKHKEYFLVEEAIAKEVIQRWTAFYSLDPYGADGQLLPFWEDRLQKHRAQRKEDFRSYGNKSDEDKLRLRWTRFTNPEPHEQLWYDISCRLDKPWQQRWHVVAFLEALIIAFITFPSGSACTWFAIMAGLVMIEFVILKKEDSKKK